MWYRVCSMEYSVCSMELRSMEYKVYIITVEEYTDMKDELPGNFKQQQKQPVGDGEAKEDKKDATTPTKEAEDTPSAEGLVKTAAAAALVSAAVKAKVSIVSSCVVNHTPLL